VPHATPAPGVSPDAETATALKLWVVLARAYQAMAERDRRDLENHGLYGSEFAVLEALFYKGPLTLGEVGRKVLLTSGSITHVVDKLEARELVARRRCAEDQRVTYAELTEAGRELVAGIFPAHVAGDPAGHVGSGGRGTAGDDRAAEATRSRRRCG